MRLFFHSRCRKEHERNSCHSSKNLRADTNDGPVYDLAGRLLGSNSTAATNLRQGVYIVNGKKLAVE